MSVQFFRRAYIYIYIYIYISNIQSASEDSGCGLFLYRIYEEYHINLCERSMSSYCYIAIPVQVYNKIHIHVLKLGWVDLQEHPAFVS